MKKIFLVLMAAAGVLATSCVKDLQDNQGGEAVVSFNVATPEIATKAFSDGTTATVLQYAVYDAAGNELTDLTVTNGEIHGSTTVSLTLTTGNTYSVIFWAAAEGAPYTVNFADKTMTVDYTNALSNAENRDAFYKFHTFTVTGAQTETIELKRPFAQLNIGTADFAVSTSAGYTPTQSSVTVPVYTTLNLTNGAVDGQATQKFALANIKKDETFPVAGNEYLAMNYLLVAADKEVVDLTFKYTDGTTEKTRTVGSVPVQRNYRTNIYGNLLTSSVDVNVEIEPDYDEPDYELDALQKAAAFGGEVTLTEDVELDKPLNIQANMVINLNGKTISGAIEKGNGSVVNIAEGVSAELIGGTINSTADNGDAAINNAGNLVLSNISINGAPLADGGYSAYAVISSGNMVIEEGTVINAERGSIKVTGAGETVINGGTFTNNDISPRTLTSHVVDVEDGSTHKLTINGGTFQHLHTNTSGGVVICNRTRGTVYVNGGNFSGGNYYGNNNLSDYGYGGTFSVKGGVFSSNPATKYLAAGYKAVEKNGAYHVVASDIDLVVSTSTEFNNALSAGESVLLNSDVNITKIDLTGVSNDVVIDANGNTITTASNYGVEVTAGKNITLRNAEVEITVNGDYINYAAGFKIANGDYAGKTIKLENCEIRMANTDFAYAVNMPASVKNLNLVIDNCVLEGAIALQCWGDNNTITVTNSKLICNYTTNAMYTSYCVALQGDGTNNSENNTLTISNCEFSYSGVDNFNSTIKSVHAHRNTTTNTITVSDCTYVDVAAY